MNNVNTDSFLNSLDSRNTNTEIDDILCKNIGISLNYNDTILNSKSYEYIDKHVLDQNINKILVIYNKYLCDSLNISNSDNLYLYLKRDEQDKLIKVQKNINFINRYNKYFPSTSKLDHKKIIELLEKQGKRQPSIMEISKLLKCRYITLYRYVRNVLLYRFVKSNRINYKSTSMQINYQTIYFSDFFSKMIKNNSFFIFIDESSFNSHKKGSKIWVNPSKKNIKYDKGRISGLNLILSVTNKEIFHYKFSHKDLIQKILYVI